MPRFATVYAGRWATTTAAGSAHGAVVRFRFPQGKAGRVPRRPAFPCPSPKGMGHWGIGGVAKTANAGALGISLRKTLMQVGGGDEQAVRKNEMRVTALLRDEGYVSRKNRWDESKTKTTRWFRGPMVLGGPRWSVVSHCTGESSVVVNDPSVGAINNNSSAEGYNGKPRTTTDHGPQPETEDLAGFDELMAEMICPRCGRETIPRASGICGQCEALAR